MSSIYGNFPRIFSLSTAGIKYHGYQDYLFHPLRTDFVGESGYGKSMIGDMLQLIFVGGREFKSGTEVDTGEARKPEGMLLDQDGQSRLGYIFLNIEVDSGKFIIIGMYIETGDHRVAPFIIQASYAWEDNAQLIPFTSPLTHQAFLRDEMLLPIEALEEEMNNWVGDEPRIIKVFRNNTKQYHTLLRQNYILPIDVANDPQKLKDYAQILRSFARGKGFKFNSNDLKSFLFGEQDGKVLLEQFEHESKQLKTSIDQYQKNKHRITEIKEVGEGLEELEDLSAQRQGSLRAYLLSDALTCYQKLSHIKKNISQCHYSLSLIRHKILLTNKREQSILLQQNEGRLHTHLADLVNLEIFNKTKVEFEVHIKALTEQLSDLGPKYQEAQVILGRLERINALVKKYKNSEQELIKQFTLQLRHIQERQQLSDLIEYLEDKDLLSSFKASAWSRNINEARTKTEERLIDLDKELKILDSLRLFSNITDPNSLANWAIDQDESLSIEQESVLLHFQSLPRHEPERTEPARFLPKPDEVFTDLRIEGQDKDGFWLDLAGIFEFIPMSSLGLTSVNRAELRAYLTEKHAELDERYKVVIKEKNELKSLERVLTDYGYTQTKTDIFARRDAIYAFTPDETLPKSQEELDDLLTLYNRNAILSEECKAIRDQYSSLDEKLKEQTADLVRLTQRIDDLCSKVANVNKVELEAAISNIQRQLQQLQNCLQEQTISQNNEADLADFTEKISNAPSDYCQEIQKELARKEGAFQEKLRSFEHQQSDAESAFQKAKLRFETDLVEVFSEESLSDTFDVEDAKGRFESCDQRFNNKINMFITKYAEEERYRLENTTDVAYLAYTTFPMIFSNVDKTKIGLAMQVAQYLDALNEKNRALDASSIETVSRVFRDVRKHYDSYMATIGLLRQFFNSEDAQITGGYNVKLRSQLSNEYPVKWLDDLRDTISLANTPMFSNETSDMLLQDIIIETFRRHAGGTRNPDLRHLLDPKSYLEIDFAIENVRGRTQGSEGQAYTAVALLCIARLSLIEGSRRKTAKGVKFMPIDEAEGIGSNFHTLYNLAISHGYQVIAMSINNVPGVKEGGQTTYSLIPNPDPSSGVNCDPFYHLGYYHEYAQTFYGKDEL